MNTESTIPPISWVTAEIVIGDVKKHFANTSSHSSLTFHRRDSFIKRVHGATNGDTECLGWVHNYYCNLLDEATAMMCADLSARAESEVKRAVLASKQSEPVYTAFYSAYLRTVTKPEEIQGTHNFQTWMRQRSREYQCSNKEMSYEGFVTKYVDDRLQNPPQASVPPNLF